MSLTIPPLPPFQPQWGDFQVWWQLAKTNIENAQSDLEAQVADIAAAQAAADAAQITATSAATAAAAAQADATSALGTLTAISADNVLSIVEKKTLVPIVQRIIDEKSGIDSQATALSITTEKTTYDTAYTALVTTYLGGLSPAYTDTTASTTIVRTTFNTKFQDYYAARQALLNKIDSVASALAIVIDPFPTVTIYADSTGTVKASQLPKSVSLTASDGSAAVTTSGTWSRTTTSGITCTIGAATGIVSITALTGSDVSVPISFTYNGVTRTSKLRVVRQDDAPTNTGGAGATGGTTGTTTVLGDTTGTSYDTTNAVSNTLTVVAGSGGRVDCSAPITYDRVTPASGSTGAIGKWQWRVPAGVFADVTTETSYAIAADSSTGDDGELAVNVAQTGLTSGSTYEFRFLWRRSNISGTNSNVYRVSGTLSAVGS